MARKKTKVKSKRRLELEALLGPEIDRRPSRGPTSARTRIRPQLPLRVGNAVFIRTVTTYYTGRIVALSRDEVILEDAAWVAWTKRFSESMATGEFAEVEPYPDGVLVSIGRGAIVDASTWKFLLPRKTVP
jgi:hypothetical protein